MTKQHFLIGTLVLLSALLTACGAATIPEYEQDETEVAIALTETREALIAEGEIVPTDVPTVDFEATTAAEQAEADAQATVDAETAQAEADVQATLDAETAQAEADAQATIDAETAQAEADADNSQPGADDPLFEAIANADVANGEMLFSIMAAPTCSTCHNITEDMLVGPGQYNVLARTIENIENGTIEADGPYSYLYNSIINPGDYIAEGFANAMPDIYEAVMSEDQIYDLVAYLVSLSD